MRARSLQVLVLTCFVAFPAGADQPGVETDEGIEAQPFLTLSHHGYLRFRADLVLNGNLGNGTGGAFLAPLHLTALNEHHGEDENLIMGANMRFRWQPELRIGQRLFIATTVDVLDNVVLGSTPAYGSPEVPLVFLSETQTGFTDAVRVKHLWADWDIMHTLRLRFGRMPDHFGLGMVRNAGLCTDCDYDGAADRVAVTLRAFGFHSMWFFDAPGDGQLSQMRDEAFGQAYDISSIDDVIRWGFDFGYTPMDRKERDEQTRALQRGDAVFDGVWRNSFTTQELSSAAQQGEVFTAAYPPDIEFQDVRLRPRSADLWETDFWFRLRWRPEFGMELRVELELAAMYGSIEHTQSIPEPASSKDFFGLGGVLQVELQHHKLTYELELGFATGDEVAFGPYGPAFNSPDDSVFASDERLRSNTTVDRFLFHRDYHVDLLMYREVIGTVTNSFYVKPSVRAHILESDEQVFGAELSLIYGHAIVPESTPGGEAPLGFETDINLFYAIPGRARFDIEAGVLAPFSAFRRGKDGPDPSVSFTLQTRATLTF